MGCGFWHTFSSLFWRIFLGVPRLRSALILCAFVCLWTQQVFRVLVRRYGEFTKLLVTWAKCCNAFAPDAVFCSFIVSPGHLTELRDKENVLLVHLRVYWNFKNLNVDNIINNYSSSPNGLMRARGKNCFGKIQLVGQKYRDKTTLASKTQFLRHCFGFQSRRFSLLVGYNI